jgi:hypothetical protein
MYNENMDKKTIEPLNNNIEIEENKSFASKEIQQKASSIYEENTQKEALAIETRNLLRQRLKHDIRQEVAKMRKHVLWLSFFFMLMFFISNSQKNNSSFAWLFFIGLQVPYYYFRKSRIVKSYTDDSEI